MFEGIQPFDPDAQGGGNSCAFIRHRLVLRESIGG